MAIWADIWVIWHKILVCGAVHGIYGGGRVGKVSRYVYIIFFWL